MTPAFRRAVLIESRGGEVRAELEDDFHRFGVTLRHDGHRVTRVEARAHRYPWVTCLEAPAALAVIEGVALSLDPTALFRHAEPRAHCTHLFELAALAIVQAARGEGSRRFEAEVTDPVDGIRVAGLRQDGELVLEWRIQDDVIADPPAYAGRRPGSFGSRALAEIEPGLAEHLFILRRVAQTAIGRSIDVDAYGAAADMGRPAECYSLQPANAPRARRILGSHLDWPDAKTLLRSVSRATPTAPG